MRTNVDIALIAWVIALICTAVFAIRRDWVRTRWFAAASVALSLLVAILR